MRRFPRGKWGRRTLIFHPAPSRPPLRPTVSLVFAWKEDKVLVCDIPGRGWCIPSGRVELDETGAEAARREAYEEGGVVLTELSYLGCYEILDRKTIIWGEVFAAKIDRFEEIPEESESSGRKLVAVEELPDIYHLWDDLTQRLFEHSRRAMNY